MRSKLLSRLSSCRCTAWAVLSRSHSISTMSLVQRLPCLPRHAVAHVGHHVGDRPRGVRKILAVLVHELDPRQCGVGRHLALAQGIFGYVTPHVLFHQAVTLAVESVVRHRVDAQRHAPHRLAGIVGVGSEEHRIGRGVERRLHAAEQDPRVGQSHVGDALHGGRDRGARGADLPPYGAYAYLGVVRAGYRVGGGHHLVRKSVIEAAGHDPHAGLRLGQLVARVEREFQQRAPRQSDGQRRGQQYFRKDSFHESVFSEFRGFEGARASPRRAVTATSCI